MSVQLKVHRGIPIYVQEDGRFKATVRPEGHPYSEEIVNKSLTAVEKAIDRLLPRKGTVDITVMFVQGTSERVSFRNIDPPHVARVVGVRDQATGRGKNAYVQRDLLDADGRQVSSHGRMYKHDPGVQAILEGIVERGKLLTEEWKSAVARLTPITKDQIITAAEAADAVAKNE